jgi:pyruvate kinase
MTSKTQHRKKPQKSLAKLRHELAVVALAGIERLRRSALDLEREYALELDDLAPELRRSAVNLLHYLAVRHHDIRELQGLLAQLGMSSLGRMEAHVMATLDAVAGLLHQLLGLPLRETPRAADVISFAEGAELLALHADAILGPCLPEHKTRIMVTMPSEAADDPMLIKALVANGMEIMRINCAHDSPAEWTRMIRHLRHAEKVLGRRCRISFDLAGPKLRTGAMQAGVQVAKWKPARNQLGQVVAPARVTLVAGEAMTAPDPGAIPVQGNLLLAVRTGDRIRFVDARGNRRTLAVVDKVEHGCVCEASATAYIAPGTVLALHRGKRLLGKAPVAGFNALPQAIALKPGDTLLLMLGDEAGRDAMRNAAGEIVAPAIVTCSLAEVFHSVQPGERIFFDDGKIAGEISEVAADRLTIRIVHATGGSARLHGEKGINLPDSQLVLSALSAKDLQDMAFAVKHADMLAMSFVQQPEDIAQLIAELDRLGKPALGIVLKIETRQAFAELPALLLEAMKHYPVAIMVARGDLGVEVGFERLSEVQEEILWLCEAAHVPVIWATQVLESLAKEGMPSRAEVTDAAMSGRAECVMLNKGPYIVQALQFLCGVLNRMEAHQQKKTSLLRRLDISQLHRALKSAKISKGK